MANTGVATIVEAELQADANSHQGIDRDNGGIGEGVSKLAPGGPGGFIRVVSVDFLYV